MTGTAFEIARVDSVFSHQFIEFGSVPARQGGGSRNVSTGFREHLGQVSLIVFFSCIIEGHELFVGRRRFTSPEEQGFGR